MTDLAQPRGPLWGRTPASQQRRRDILAAGKRVFFESGYQLASVDRIAEAAGTTKRTVYDHFGAKEALFAEVVAFACRQFIDMLPTAVSLPAAPAEGMRAFTARVGELVGTPDAVRFQRLVIAEAERNPGLGLALYETAVLGAERVLADYLDACVAAGRLAPHDTAVTARTVLDLATNAPRLRGLTGLAGGAADPVGAAALDQAIELLVSRFAPGDGERAL